MYVCNCNGVRQREIDSAIDAGARCPREALAMNAAEPCCGQCLPDIAMQIDRKRGARRKEASLVAAE
ncbi:MAG: bacterioferritin-associated ferredoxin [Hyphomonadaceae bacterium]